MAFSYDEPIRYNEGKVDWTLLPWDENTINILSINLNELNNLKEEELETALIQSLLKGNITYCLAASLMLVGEQPKQYSFSELPWTALEQVCRVFSYGCIKYSRDNYKIAPGLPLESYIQSMWRHLVEYLRGNLEDEGSTLEHLSHVACNAFMYLWTQKIYHEPNTEDTSVQR